MQKPFEGSHNLTTSHHEDTRNHGGRIRHNDDGVFEGSFVASSRNITTVSILPWYRRKEYFLDGWTDTRIWRAALIEGVGTAGVVYMSGQMGATISSYGTKQIGAYIALYNTVLISVFIYATAPASGGHLNPVISFSSILCGICPLARGTLYMLAQTLGGALAGGLLAGSWGYERSVANQGGGCFFDPSVISTGQVLLTEVWSAFILIFLAFGVGLDPRQALLFGPQLGPILVGLSLGVVAFSTTGVAPGYTGANLHPARCFGYAIARRDFSGEWVWWVGPGAGALLQACLYNLVPPYHAETGKSLAPSPGSV